MSRTKLLAVASAFALGFLISVLTVSTAQATKCYCSSTTFQTSTQSGYGFTCTQATNDLQATLDPEVDCSFLGFGSCLEALVITEECHAHSPSEVEVVGYISYRCKWCGTLP